MGKNLQFIANTLEMSPFDGIERTFKLRSMMKMMMHLSSMMMMMMIVYELDLMRSSDPSNNDNFEVYADDDDGDVIQDWSSELAPTFTVVPN